MNTTNALPAEETELDTLSTEEDTFAPPASYGRYTRTKCCKKCETTLFLNKVIANAGMVIYLCNDCMPGMRRE